MNKDVVYIEPDDDITDIITKIENAKEKIVALVPPKKASVFRSIVNIKLIAKAGASAEKTVVLVTTDPSIVKLAAATRLPVTKNLQTAPEIPEFAESDGGATESAVKVVVGSDGGATAEEAPEGEKAANLEAAEASADVEGGKKADEGADAVEGESEGSGGDSDDSAGESGENREDAESNKTEVADEKKSQKHEKGEKKAVTGVEKRFSKAWFKAHWKLCTGAGCGVAALILLLVWMFAIAPAATVDVEIRTSTANFSENVSFTTKLTDEDAENGKFYLTEKKMETTSSVEFSATGQKNVGEKASGSVKIYAYFQQKGTSGITKGDTISINGLKFAADEAATVTWDGTIASCSNQDAILADINVLYKPGCLVYGGSVKVTATEVGAKYNVSASSSGWETTANVGVYSESAMTGGLDKMVTVVQQSDVDAAKEALKLGNEAANKEKLLDSLEEGAFVIESSYKQTISDAVSSPKVGEEVKEGETAKLTVVVTDSIYTIDRVKVEEFIMTKAKLAENYKIYSMNDPFVENFSLTDEGGTGKLKTSYVAGPAVTVADVLDIVRGKGTGTATHELLDIDGIGSVTITTSYPWVTSVPGDDERITVNIDTRE